MKGQKGITLIALVITIIVMLILVGVTITVAMQGGLFDKARQAATDTNNAAKGETSLGSGYINVNNNLYAIEDYAVNGTEAATVAAASAGL